MFLSVLFSLGEAPLTRGLLFPPNHSPTPLLTIHRAVKAGCVNAQHPDKYGHYREARFTQTKHHWWWKANRSVGTQTQT